MTLILLLLALAAGEAESPVDSATVPRTAAALTLAEAVTLSVDAHEDAAIALYQYEVATARRNQTLARVLPQVSLSGSVSYQPETGYTQGGTTVPVPSRTIISGRAAISTALIDLGALPDYLSAADVAEAQKMASEEARRLLAFTVSQQFLTVLAVEQVLEAANKRSEVAEATVQDAEARARAGAGRPSDVTRAQLERSAARLGVVGAMRDVELARISLGELLGPQNESRGEATLVPPSDSLIPFPIEGTDLPQRALGDRRDLARVELLVAAARNDVWENLAGFLPRLSAVADLTKQDDGVIDRDTQWSASLVMSWQLFEGGRKLSADSERRARLSISELEAQQLERAIRNEVRSAERQLTASLEEARQAEIQAQLAASNQEQTGAMFTHGLVTALERVDAIAAAFEADATLARRQLEARLAELDLLRAVGGWPEGAAPVLE